MKDEIESTRAGAGIPAGIVPTPEMLTAGRNAVWISVEDPGEFNLTENEAAAVWAAMLAASPAVSAPAWQPIETAPKDGRDLLLWESGSSVPFVGAWRGGRRPGWHCDTEHYNTDGNACVVSNLWQEGVTHWMPLPAAPGFAAPVTAPGAAE